MNSIINIDKLEGTYRIIGSNQDKEQSSYTGYLRLILTNEYRVDAIWTISAVQTGKGFFKDDILVVNFSYEGEVENGTRMFKDVVVYKFINESILDGFWSEKHGDDNYLGFEGGHKITTVELSNLL